VASAVISTLSEASRRELEEFVDRRIAAALKKHREQRRWMSVAETADYLDTTEVAIRRRISRGRIVVKRMGRSVLIDRLALDRELERS